MRESPARQGQLPVFWADFAAGRADGDGRGATAVAPYSTRARPGALVSTPVAWDELAGIRGDSFHVPGVLGRLARQGPDPWARFFKIEQTLPAAAMAAAGAGRRSP